MIKIDRIPVIRRKDRHIVGVTMNHFERVDKLRKTKAGTLSFAAVCHTVIELGLKQLEAASGIDVQEV